MKKIALLIVVSLIATAVRAEKKTIELMRNNDISFKLNQNVSVPKVSIKKETSTSEDLVYKFNQVKDELWRFKSDTTRVRNDIQNLLSEARRISQSGQQNYWFSNDLRNMSYKMSQWSNDIGRISYSLKDLLNIAKKDKDLNQIASDIEWYASDVENSFQFDVENAARDLEYTVRGIDPKLIGYDAQWNAMDISRYASDISAKARDMYWDARELLNKTQP